MEAYVSAHVHNTEVSLGKQDDRLGLGLGGGMAMSNNAENLYTFRINRVKPMIVPFLSKFTGPFRYEFLIGPMKGHVYPRESLYASRAGELQTFGESRNWIRANCHLGRTGSRACHSSHLPEKLCCSLPRSSLLKNIPD